MHTKLNEHDNILDEMIMIMPNVLNEMKRNGHLKTWISLSRMVNDGSFPFDNIAFLLFMDECRLCSPETYSFSASLSASTDLHVTNIFMGPRHVALQRICCRESLLTDMALYWITSMLHQMSFLLMLLGKCFVACFALVLISLFVYGIHMFEWTCSCPEAVCT